MFNGAEGIMLKQVFIAAVLMGVAWAGNAGAQGAAGAPKPEPIKRTVLQKFDVPGTDYETVIGIAEIAPGVNIGRHTHPGAESGYLLEGDMTLIVANQPDRPLKTGDSYQIPVGAAHDARSGEKGARVIATYVVEKGKPLASPTQ
jgi:quercetin dioxygenase-like cupin family protein